MNETKLSKPSIDWSHVSDKFNCLARDYDGSVYLYEKKPEMGDDSWSPRTSAWGDVISAAAFKSLDAGNCDWAESLVERPKN